MGAWRESPAVIFSRLARSVDRWTRAAEMTSRTVSEGYAKFARIVLRCLQDGKCFWCGQPMLMSTADSRRKDMLLPNHPDAETFEHLKPRRYGRDDSLSNLALVHKRCNR